MAKSRTPIDRDMEEREGTDEEIREAVGGFAAAPAAPIPPYRGDREEDQPDRERPAMTLPAPDMLTRMEAALTSLEEKATAPDASSDLATALGALALAIQGMKDGQLQGSQIIADMQRKTMRPENDHPPNVSAFNPRGDKDFPRPPLRCEYLMPWPIKPGSAEELTREEIELLNLLEPGEVMITRADRTRIKFTVRIERKLDSEEPSRVLVHHDTAFNNDHHKLLPFDWIRQLVESNPKTREAAKAVVTMEEEEALILARKFNDGRLAGPGERVVSVGA